MEKALKSFGFLFILLHSALCLELPGYGELEENQEYTTDFQKFYRYQVPYGHVPAEHPFQPAEPTENPKLDTDLYLMVTRKNNSENAAVLVNFQYDPSRTKFDHYYQSSFAQKIMTHDVVMVSVSYRSYGLGFISTNTEEIPGNAAIKDMILALNWVQKYIKYFGGDSTRVTVMGQHHVAGILGTMTMSPLAENLFHQVIYQSGSPLMDNLTTTEPIHIARKVGEKIYCKNVDDVTLLSKCLVEKHDLVEEAYKDLMGENNGLIYPVTIGGPSGVLEGTESIQDRVKAKKFRPYPSIGGVVDHPGIFLMDGLHSQFYSIFSGDHMKKQIVGDNEDYEAPDTYKKLINALSHESDFEVKFMLNHFLQTGEQIEYIYDIPMKVDMVGADLKLAVVSFLDENTEKGGRSYLYAFKKDHTEHLFYKKKESLLKNYVTIGDDNMYLMETPSGESKEISKFMTELFTNFVDHGVPESYELYKWPSLESFIGPYLIFDDIPHIGLHYFHEFFPMISCAGSKYCEWIDDKAFYLNL